MKGLIIDGWNLFSYDGIPNDSKDKKTVAVKQLGNECAEIMLDVNVMKFEFVKNGMPSVSNIARFSTCLKLADSWFESMEDKFDEK
jgi:hypothetical protein